MSAVLLGLAGRASDELNALPRGAAYDAELDRQRHAYVPAGASVLAIGAGLTVGGAVVIAVGASRARKRASVDERLMHAR